MIDGTEVPAGGAPPQDAPAKGASIRAATDAIRAKVDQGEISPTLDDPRIGATKPTSDVLLTVAESLKREREGGEGGGDGTAAAAPELVVPLPLRHDNDTPLEIEVEDQEAADRLRMAINNGVRRDQLQAMRAELDQELESVREVADEIEVDPVSFVFARLPEQHYTTLARHLLAHPGVLDQLSQDPELFSDPERAQLRLEAERAAVAREWSEKVQARGTARHHTREVVQAIDRMIPQQMTDEQANMLRDDLLRDAKDHAERGGSADLLRPETLVGALARRLGQYGVDPETALAAITKGGPARIRSAGAGAPAARDVQRTEAAARGAGQKFAARAVTRRSAGAVPGAGAGSPAAGPALPKGQGIKDRVKTMRQRLGLA